MTLETNKKSFIPGVLILTIIFLGLSIYSIYNMFSGQGPTYGSVEEKSYVSLLEKELNIKIDKENEFEIIDSLGYEALIIPSKYKHYYKPPFDFVVLKDGAKIISRNAKEYSEYPIQIGSMIVEIDDKKLAGLKYFEILDLMYSLNENVVRKFTLSDGTSFEYTYKMNNQRYEIVSSSENEIEVKFYNLNNKFITRKGIYELVKSYEEVTFDLSSATISDYDSIVNFLSFFSNDKMSLFESPSDVFGYSSMKLHNVKIKVGNNEDKGINFIAANIKKLNSNVQFDITEFSVTSYDSSHILSGKSYDVIIYNRKLTIQKDNISGGVLV